MSVTKCLSFSLPLFVVPLLLLFFTLVSYPHPPQPLPGIYHSLASLPPAGRSWSVYPDHFYPGGNYAILPQGRTRYWLMGPEKGKKIVLIHGLSIPSMVYQDVAPVLAAKGYRVLLYDLYGRGYSDAPQTTHDAALYVTQLALLMQHIRWEKANIVGVSMGAAIGVAFADAFPQLVNGKVALIASAGLLLPLPPSKVLQQRLRHKRRMRHRQIMPRSFDSDELGRGDEGLDGGSVPVGDGAVCCALFPKSIN